MLNNAEAEGRICRIASISFWELHRKEGLGKLAPRIPVRKWPALSAPLTWLQVINTTPDIWLKTEAMPWTHRDPADRVIAATALRLHQPVLTKDSRFHAPDSPVSVVW